MEILLTVVLGVLGFPVVVQYIIDAWNHRNKRTQQNHRNGDRKPVAS
jgi:hypothetical protein